MASYPDSCLQRLGRQDQHCSPRSTCLLRVGILKAEYRPCRKISMSPKTCLLCVVKTRFVWLWSPLQFCPDFLWSGGTPKGPALRTSSSSGSGDTDRAIATSNGRQYDSTPGAPSPLPGCQPTQAGLDPAYDGCACKDLLRPCVSSDVSYRHGVSSSSFFVLPPCNQEGDASVLVASHSFLTRGILQVPP